MPRAQSNTTRTGDWGLSVCRAPCGGAAGRASRASQASLSMPGKASDARKAAAWQRQWPSSAGMGTHPPASASTAWARQGAQGSMQIPPDRRTGRSASCAKSRRAQFRRIISASPRPQAGRAPEISQCGCERVGMAASLRGSHTCGGKARNASCSVARSRGACKKHGLGPGKSPAPGHAVRRY